MKKLVVKDIVTGAIISIVSHDGIMHSQNKQFGNPWIELGSGERTMLLRDLGTKAHQVNNGGRARIFK